MNDTVFVECARALGKRLAEARGDVPGRIGLGVRWCLGREATPAERDRLARLYGELLGLARADPAGSAKLVDSYKSANVDASEAAAWVAIGRALLNLDEFITRE
jgi:hypothetical protein